MNSLDGIECIIGEEFHLRQCARLSNAFLNCFNKNEIERIEIINENGYVLSLDKEIAQSISLLIESFLHHQYYSGEKVKLRLKKEDGSIEDDYERYSEIKNALEYK